MSAHLKLVIVFVSSLLTMMLIIGALMGQSKDDSSPYKPLRVYTDVLARIKSEYVEEPDLEKVTNGALHGLVEHLDPMSSYLTPDQYAKYQDSLDHPDGGTGISTGLVVRKRGGYAQVLSVLPGSPADAAGIEIGDFIEAIEGLSARALPPAYLSALLSGEPGTELNLLVRPIRQSDEPQEHVLTRANFELPPVKHKSLDSGFGYIDVDYLSADQVDQVGEAVRELEANGAESIILDLRGSAAGGADQGLRLADLFVNEGLLASLKGQQHPEQKFRADPEATVTKLPLVVITDRATSAAAEITTAAILDSRRGDVVGERTYGLASKQEEVEMDDGAALILSVAKYYRPSGEEPIDSGVEPNYPLTPRELRAYREAIFGPEGQATPPPRREISTEKDPFVQKAIRVLRGEEKREPKSSDQTASFAAPQLPLAA